MSKISTYPSADTPLLLSDRLIGTEAIRTPPSKTPLATKNFSLGELLELFSTTNPTVTLQGVLNVGNTATQNITLIGTIDATLIKTRNIEDPTGSQGTVFQYLSKGVSSINWVDLPISTLQAVLDAGNTATQNINLIGNVTATKIIPGNIQDDTSGVGTIGQLLSKTASGIRWINNPTPPTAGLADVLSVGNTATNDIALIGNIIVTKAIPENIEDEDSNIGLSGQVLSKTASGIRWVSLPPSASTLQEVTDNGNTTTDDIIAGGFASLGNANLPAIDFNDGDDLNVSRGILSTLGTITTPRNWNLPDKNGTIALTSDITIPTLQQVLNAGFITSSYIIFTSLSSPYEANISNGSLVFTNGELNTTFRYSASGLAFEQVPLSKYIYFNVEGSTIVTKDGYTSTFKFPDTLTQNSTITLPNKNGTVAMTSDIPSPTAILTTTITDGDTTHAPDGNSVFDALAGKVNNTGAETIAGAKTFSSLLTMPSTGVPRILQVESSGQISGLDLLVYPSLAELAYVKGVTSPIQTQIDAVNVNVITITTAVSINTDTVSGAYGQHGRHVKISNGANAINLTVQTSSNADFVASYTKIGTSAITFVAGSGTTLTVMGGGSAILNGAVGSTALLVRNGNIYYLQLNNY